MDAAKLIRDQLWTLFEAYPAFDTIVKPGNRIKTINASFDARDLKVMLDGIADFPSLRVQTRAENHAGALPLLSHASEHPIAVRVDCEITAFCLSQRDADSTAIATAVRNTLLLNPFLGLDTIVRRAPFRRNDVSNGQKRRLAITWTLSVECEFYPSELTA